MSIIELRFLKKRDDLIFKILSANIKPQIPFKIRNKRCISTYVE